MIDVKEPPAITDEPRKRGEGSVFQRGERWWVKFYVDGKPQREPARLQRRNGLSEPASTVEEAEKYLAGRLRKVHHHDEDPTKPFITQRDRRRTVTDLIDALEMNFRKRKKDTPQNLSLLKRARDDFGHFRATQLTAEDVDLYTCERLKPTDREIKPSAPASINRVLEVLSQAYKLANLPAPRIDCLSEVGNERKGFFTEQAIRAVIANLPADLADFTLFGWFTGMRAGEIEALSWEDVDGDVIRLAAIDSKEREARLIPLEGELAELIERRIAVRQVKLNGTVMLASLIFHREGSPISEFRKSWATACCDAGVGKLVCRKCLTDATSGGKCSGCGRNLTREDLKYVGRTFHDLRRSACRDMVKAGVPEKTAMEISGHKTNSMFKRYAILATEEDLRAALRRTQEYRRTTASEKAVITMPRERAQNGHNAGTAVQARVAK